jgi:hypothetical protein
VVKGRHRFRRGARSFGMLVRRDELDAGEEEDADEDGEDPMGGFSFEAHIFECHPKITETYGIVGG